MTKPLLTILPWQSNRKHSRSVSNPRCGPSGPFLLCLPMHLQRRNICTHQYCREEGEKAAFLCHGRAALMRAERVEGRRREVYLCVHLILARRRAVHDWRRCVLPLKSRRHFSSLISSSGLLLSWKPVPAAQISHL